MSPLRPTWRPLLICVLLGLGLLVVDGIRTWTAASEWRDRTTQLLADALQRVAAGGLTQLFEALDSKMIQLEGWAGLHFMPQNIEVEDADSVIGRSLVDLRKRMGFTEAVCIGANRGLVASSEGMSGSPVLRSVPWSSPPTTASLLGPIDVAGRPQMLFEAPVAQRLVASATGGLQTEPLRGVLRATVDWRRLTQGVFDNITAQHGSGRDSVDAVGFVVFDGQRRVLATDMHLGKSTLPELGWVTAVDSAIAGTGRGWVRLGEKDYILGAASSQQLKTFLGRHHSAIGQSQLGFLVLQEARSVLAALDSQTAREVWISVLVSVVGVLVLFVVLIWRFLAPMMRFVSFAVRISQGHTSERLDVVRGSEFEALSRSLNQMLDTIQGSTSKLQELATQKALFDESARRERTQQLMQRHIDDHIDKISQVAQGNLGVRFSEDGPPEMAVLGQHLNHMVGQIGRLLGEMRGAVVRLGTVTSEILATVTQQTDNFQHQNDLLRRTGRSVEDIRGAASETTTHAEKVVEKAGDSSRVFRDGELALEEVAGAMLQISDKARVSGESMQRLTEQLDKIDDILGSVNDIAEQSKLLSLNAAIEAARAREYGKGFAVVALEVRNLAVQSREATGQIKGILRGIREAAEQVAGALQVGREKVELGVDLTSRVRMLQDQLKSALDGSLQLALRVRVASNGQHRSLEDINDAMRDTIQRMEQNTESARNIQETLQELSLLAGSLQNSAGAFRNN